jgi:hypothetical protein
LTKLIRLELQSRKFLWKSNLNKIMDGPEQIFISCLVQHSYNFFRLTYQSINQDKCMSKIDGGEFACDHFGTVMLSAE